MGSVIGTFWQRVKIPSGGRDSGLWTERDVPANWGNLRSFLRSELAVYTALFGASRSNRASLLSTEFDSGPERSTRPGCLALRQALCLHGNYIPSLRAVYHHKHTEPRWWMDFWLGAMGVFCNDLMMMNTDTPLFSTLFSDLNFLDHLPSGRLC